MTTGRLAVVALAMSLALGAAVAALADDPGQTRVRAIDLDDQIDVSRRDERDDEPAPVEDDEPRGDRDATRGDDGTNGGDNTGDGDATDGNDGTGGGDNTGDGDATDGNDGTGGGDDTYSGGAGNDTDDAGTDDGGTD